MSAGTDRWTLFETRLLERAEQLQACPPVTVPQARADLEQALEALAALPDPDQTDAYPAQRAWAEADVIWYANLLALCLARARQRLDRGKMSAQVTPAQVAGRRREIVAIKAWLAGVVQRDAVRAIFQAGRARLPEDERRAQQAEGWMSLEDELTTRLH